MTTCFTRRMLAAGPGCPSNTLEESFGPDQQLAYRYEFDYKPSETTRRMILQSVQECAGDGTCKAATRFHYPKVETGFDEVVTEIDAPLSHKASPMLFDVDHDGLPEYVVGDSTPSSTPSNPVTEWRIAKNTGDTFAAEKVALVQEWSFVQDPQGLSDPTLLQPELGTSAELTGDSLLDLFLHDVTGSQANHMLLAAKADLTFDLVDTGIRRPFPLQQSPKRLRNGAGAVHLADCNGDAKPDLIHCTDHGDALETASLSTWKLHVWRPGGFTPDGEIINTLTGIPCGVEMHTVDANRDTITDLIATGYVRQGSMPTALSGTYSVHRRRSDAAWEVFDTGLPTPAMGGRTIFLDGNGDGYPDAVQSGAADGRLYTYMNTGLGFAERPTESLPWDGQLPQSKYFHLAQPLDFDGDSKTDLLVPMVDAISPDVPRWVILRATGKNTFERIESGIPFQPALTDVVDIANPHGPRVTDVDGNGSPDVAIFLSNRLHIFKNRAIDPDVLIGFSDGSNDHDPDEPAFVPNVSMAYGHLIDDPKTKGQPAKEDDFYVSQADSANECKYPRICVVGPRRVVSGYEVNDGQGGVRRFELRYRDGRSDRLHGWLGFGKRMLVDLDTGSTTATFYDNVTKANVGEREVYPFAGQITHQWRWTPGLATQPNPDQIEMVKIDGIRRLIERTTTTGGGDDETILDSLGRPIRTFTHGPEPKANTRRVMQVIEYDRLSGNVTRKSVPAAKGTPDALLEFDEYEFDALGREVRRVTPWNAVTTTKYDGLLVDVTEPLSKHTITQIDTLGRPVTITDAKNGITKYAYGPFDALSMVTDPGNAVTKWTRDAFGRPTKIEEPDRGTTTLKHNGFGDLLSSTDALGRVAAWEFDLLGRTTSRTDKLGAQVLTTTWTWDTALHGIGRLHSVISPDGVKTYGYNKRGQTETIKLGVAGEVFAARVHYDDVGHAKALDYPQPLGEEPFGVVYDYDAYGFRTAVRDNVTKDAFWELKDVDDAGRYSEELFGNGTKTVRAYDNDKQALKNITTTLGGSTIQQLSYDFDERLNLKSRSDALQPQNKTERFKVDALDRLTCAYFGLVENANAACHTSYAYAANGNLMGKSDVGTLSYMDPKHPHAVTNAPGETFEYNAVGNQITRPGGISITYTPFDLPKTITKDGQTTTFGYDGDEQRIRKTTASSETLSFGDLFEQVTNGAVKEFRYYVHSPERTIAIVTRGGNEAGTKYLLADHLGSVETVTNENGAVVEKRSYDAFGARRNPQWGASGGAFTSKTKKGFTGHEEEDEFGLVNMKGRLLDPRLGRFTTTDPVIADIFDAQTLNAFSYVGNNPLTYIDPTGFQQQPTQSIPVILDTIEQTVISQYPDDFVPEPEPEYAPEALEATNSLRFTTDVGTMGDGGSPQESEGLDRREQIADVEGGYLFGVLEGLVPFAGVGHSLADTFGLSDNKSREARFGLAIGQIVGGVITTIGGISGEVLGGVATVTGIGAALGVPVMVVSTVAVAGGIGNIAAGIRGLASVMNDGGGTRAPPEVKNALNIAEDQFGKEIGKHASDYGLNAGNATHRETLRGIIHSISNRPDKIVQGTFKGQDGLVDFFIKGNDVVVGKGGEFVTLMKDGINNPAVRRAMGLP